MLRKRHGDEGNNRRRSDLRWLWLHDGLSGRAHDARCQAHADLRGDQSDPTSGYRPRTTAIKRQQDDTGRKAILNRTITPIWGPLLLSAFMVASPALAQKAYSPGASDTEIKLGQSTPLSGPASAFGAGAGRAVVGYFEMLNEKGGINGRKVNFTQLDNAYSAPKAIEQSRKLTDDVGVLAEVGTIGTVPNVAIQKYLNGKGIPQLFIIAGGRRFNDPKHFPWTVPL